MTSVSLYFDMKNSCERHRNNQKNQSIIQNSWTSRFRIWKTSKRIYLKMKRDSTNETVRSWKVRTFKDWRRSCNQRSRSKDERSWPRFASYEWQSCFSEQSWKICFIRKRIIRIPYTTTSSSYRFSEKCWRYWRNFLTCWLAIDWRSVRRDRSCKIIERVETLFQRRLEFVAGCLWKIVSLYSYSLQWTILDKQTFKKEFCSKDKSKYWPLTISKSICQSTEDLNDESSFWQQNKETHFLKKYLCLKNNDISIQDILRHEKENMSKNKFYICIHCNESTTYQTIIIKMISKTRWFDFREKTSFRFFLTFCF